MTLPHPAGDPFQHPFGTVAHYYGDIVRALFVAAAIMAGVAIPFSGELTTGAIIGAPAIVILLVLAGLTNPHGKTIVTLDAVVSAAGVVFTQLLALSAYSQEYFPLFAFLEAISIVFMAALYFSVKTLRAMAAHKVGKADDAREFDDTNI